MIPTDTKHIQDLSFAQTPRSETLWGPHGYHRYPAKFIPQLVRHFIEMYSTRGQTVADPFLGSGTTGVEALRTGREFWGCDINPVAAFISRTKCTPLDPDTLNATLLRLEPWLERVSIVGRRALTTQERTYIKEFKTNSNRDRRTYWFPTIHRMALATILDSILDVSEGYQRDFLLCAFSNILRRCSIWLSGSTKPQKDLNRQLSDPVSAFRSQVAQMQSRNRLYWKEIHNCIPDCRIEVADTRQLPLPDGSVDLIVTSPPYATCYEYIALHQLTQLWFEPRGLLPEVDLTHNIIGSSEVARRPLSQPTTTGSMSADSALIELLRKSEEVTPSLATAIQREARALAWYFNDMRTTLEQFARVITTEGYCILIIGDSRRRGINIPTATALREQADKVGMVLRETITRTIPIRALVSQRNETTGRFSTVAESNIQAYPEEKILVFQRRS